MIERLLQEGIGAASFSKNRSVNFNGVWKNNLGSEMTLAVDQRGTVSGKYRTGVGAPDPAEEFPLTGFVSGDLIVFCVNFGEYDSLTAWAGQHSLDANQQERIYTLWHLAKNVEDPDEPGRLWAGIHAGANEYVRG